jgi:hypothetical protein
MFESKNKTDLIIEVWEKLDCESVGREELVAIETVVRDVYGESAVDSPMIVARLLADEGAELRHSEIMHLFIERASDRPHEAAIQELFDLTDLDALHSSLRKAENLRKMFLARNEQTALRLLRDRAIEVKAGALSTANDPRRSEDLRRIQAEAAEWITLWLQSPELLENWVRLRQASEDFKRKFK